MRDDYISFAKKSVSLALKHQSSVASIFMLTIVLKCTGKI